MTTQSLSEPEEILIGPRRVKVWPEGQHIKNRGDRVLGMTQFEDTECYHPALVKQVLELEADPAIKRTYNFAASGTKIHFLHGWTSPEAELLAARAKALYMRAYKQPEATIHVGWVNISRNGEYTMAHTHPDSTASIVYCLDPGGPDPNDPAAGQLHFVDPRYEACCRTHPGYMTTPFAPKMPPGAMIIFPSSLVHAVNPYRGTRPRITLAWDINTTAVGQPRVLDVL